MVGWSASGGRLVPALVGPARDRLDAGSVAWLCAGGGPLRVRFALRLADRERVVGFGERFDRVDQRERQLDVTVFEHWLHGLGIRLVLWQIPLQRARPAPSGQARADRDTMVERGYYAGQAASTATGRYHHHGPRSRLG